MNPRGAFAAALLLGAMGCGDDGATPTPDAGADAGAADGGGLDAGGTDSGADAGPATWATVGARVSPAGTSGEDPEVMLVGGSTPAVGYRRDSFEARLHLWDGSSWGDAEPDPTGGQLVTSVHRAPGWCSDGAQVWMTYAHEGESGAADPADFYNRVFLYRWTEAGGWEHANGTAEVSQGIDGDEVGYNADEANVGCRAGGDPAVAWRETDLAADAQRDAHLAIVGTAVDASPRIDRLADAASDQRALDVAFDASGTAYLAHFEHTGTALETALFVESYGGELAEIGGELGRDADSNTLSAPSIVPVAADDVYVAWASADDTDTHQVFVSHWDGSEWALLGDGPVEATSGTFRDAQEPDLVLVDGTPTLAWSEADDDGTYVFVAQWGGASWALLGDRVNVDVAREARDPSLAHDPSGDTLYVAFEEYVEGAPAVFVRSLAL